MKPKYSLPSLTLLLIAALISGCASPGFRDAWVQAVSGPAPTDITGAWEGTWKSEATGHTGDLRCLVTRDEETSNDYRFHYWASWKRFVSGEFVVEYPVTQRGDRFSFGGKYDLGKSFGGTFTHEAVATPVTYDATYSAAADKGTVTMVRPKSKD